MTWAPLWGQVNVWYGGTKACSGSGAVSALPACVESGEALSLIVSTDVEGVASSTGFAQLPSSCGISSMVSRSSSSVLRACLETHLSIMKRFNSMLAMAI